MTSFDQLTAEEQVLLDLLAAQYKLGNPAWPVTKEWYSALGRLAVHGLVDWTANAVGDRRIASITAGGRHVAAGRRFGDPRPVVDEIPTIADLRSRIVGLESRERNLRASNEDLARNNAALTKARDELARLLDAAEDRNAGYVRKIGDLTRERDRVATRIADLNRNAGYKCDDCHHGLGYHDDRGCHYRWPEVGRNCTCARDPLGQFYEQARTVEDLRDGPRLIECGDCHHALSYHDGSGCHYPPDLSRNCSCRRDAQGRMPGRADKIRHPSGDDGGDGMAWDPWTQEVRQIIVDLTDVGPCSYDHHGYCQAHSWLQDGECPHARAKRYLKTD